MDLTGRAPDGLESDNGGPRRFDPVEIIHRIDELLEVTYRSGNLGNFDDVLSETVYILLSLNTREAVYRRVFARLRRRYPRWLDVANSRDPRTGGRAAGPGASRRREPRTSKRFSKQSWRTTADAKHRPGR